MELPQRKKLRLKDYDYSSCGAYFVTICVKDRQKILGNIIVGDDAHIVPHMELSQIGTSVKKYIDGICGIHKYCIMPNHIHMIIFISHGEDGTMWASSPTQSTQSTQSVSQRVRSFKILVTKEIGFPLFQRSYHDHVIRGEGDYQRLCQYIDENPLKWQNDCYYNSMPQ